LLLAHRAGRLAEQLPLSVMGIRGTSAGILPGPRSHAQAHSALDLWEPLSLVWRSLHQEGTDIFIDAGRLGMNSYAEPLLRLADLILLVTRSDLPSLAAARQWAEQAVTLRVNQPQAPEWAVLLVGAGNPYGPGEVAEVLGLPVVAVLGLDGRGASVFSAGTRMRRPGKLDRDLRKCGENLRQKLVVVDKVITPRGAK